MENKDQSDDVSMWRVQCTVHISKYEVHLVYMASLQRQIGVSFSSGEFEKKVSIKMNK